MLTDRIAALERAVVGLGRVELGDVADEARDDHGRWTSGGGGGGEAMKDQHDDPNAYHNGSVKELRQGDWVQPETSGDTHDPKQLDRYESHGNVREGDQMVITLTFKDGTKVDTTRGERTLYYRPPDSKFTANGDRKLGA